MFAHGRARMFQFLQSIIRRTGIGLGLIDERARLRRHVCAWFRERGYRAYGRGRSYAADRARYYPA